MPVVVRIKRLSPEATLPTYAREGDAGADLYASSSCFLHPGETMVFWANIAIEMPSCLEAQVRPRSSLSKRGILGHLGTIDSGYRGDIGVTLTNLGKRSYEVKKGDRIAQLVFQYVARGEFVEVAELSMSERGEGGFGSTGV